MNGQINAFLDDLKSTHGQNLASVILYGSSAAGDHVADHSDHNILVALKTIGPDDLKNAHACIREWVRTGQPVPVYFTVDELREAADVFPIEIQQMTVARHVLYGLDVLDGVEVSDINLRLQTEYELRSKLIQLRRHYIRASASVEGLKTLMSESLSSFAAFFRAALILKGVEPPVTKREIIALTARHFGINAQPFEKILNIRENNFAGKLDEKSANLLFGEYMQEIEAVIEAVDALDKPSLQN